MMMKRSKGEREKTRQENDNNKLVSFLLKCNKKRKNMLAHLQPH